MTRGRLEDGKSVTRKDFISRAGAFTWLGGLLLGLMGSLRSAIPAVLPDPSLRFKIGEADEYAPGLVKDFVDEAVLVVCDEEGLFAISRVCTHLGCLVRRESDGFHCPCHGSRFDPMGRVLHGPAPSPLPWLQVARLPSGQLSVDRGRTVPLNTKYELTETDHG